MKNLIRHILKESTEEKFINTMVDKIKSGVIKAPYFKNLKKFAADDQEIEIIFKMLFGEGITIGHNETDGDYHILDDEGKRIYYEISGGFWIKRKYDEMGNKISYEDSDGEWEKSEYDDGGNLIYFENSFRGVVRDLR